MVNGLKQEQVNQRINEGKVNVSHDHMQRTTKDIVYSNVFTFFNAINTILGILVICTGQFRNALFMVIIIANTVFAIIQELRAKKQLDSLKVLTAAKAIAIRDGKEKDILQEEIVLDDVIKISTGNQVLADSEILEGEISVNESLLTGESDDIEKKPGDKVYAGSFVTRGTGITKVIAVGDDNWIHKIIANAKRAKVQPSRLRDALNFILKIVSIVLIPIGVILFVKSYIYSGETLSNSILSSVASMVGMIPEGLVLLTTVALTVGTMKLAQKNVLVQELYSLETFARCDTICLDKTGTITTGNMNFHRDEVYTDDEDFDNIVANIVTATKDHNATSIALQKEYKVKKPLDIASCDPFSSKTKSSGITLKNGDVYKIGAYQFLGCKSEKVERKIKEYSLDGYRVLTVTKNNEAIGIVVLADEIKRSVKGTFEYFYSQGVNLKIISGDDVTTVSNILKQLDFKDAEKVVDCSKVSDEELKVLAQDNAVFGRVTPEQKMLILNSLKDAGHTVGMVGDGVNDVMALKEADFSIAMNAGADSAKSVANVVLLDNDFDHMPEIIGEGRRVINNISRTATLFLSKAMITLCFTIGTFFFLPSFPFLPVQISLYSTLCVGYPSFILSFEPRYQIVKKDFLNSIFKSAISCGLSVFITSIALIALFKYDVLPSFNLQTMQILVIIIVMLYSLISIAKPISFVEGALLSTIVFALIAVFTIQPLSDYFMITELSFVQVLIAGVIGFLSIRLYELIKSFKVIDLITRKLDDMY